MDAEDIYGVMLSGRDEEEIGRCRMVRLQGRSRSRQRYGRHRQEAGPPGASLSGSGLHPSSYGDGDPDDDDEDDAGFSGPRRGSGRNLCCPKPKRKPCCPKPKPCCPKPKPRCPKKKVKCCCTVI